MCPRATAHLPSAVDAPEPHRQTSPNPCKTIGQILHREGLAICLALSLVCFSPNDMQPSSRPHAYCGAYVLADRRIFRKERRAIPDSKPQKFACGFPIRYLTS